MDVQKGGLLMVEPGAGRSILLGKGHIKVDFKVWGHQTGGRYAIVEQTIEARRLVPPNTLTLEDVLLYVIEGRIGVRVGDEVVEAGVGSYVFVHRGVPHAGWNPTDEPARLLVLICPGGLENYYVELADFYAAGGRPGSPEHEAIRNRYKESGFMDWVPELKSRYGLKLVGES